VSSPFTEIIRTTLRQELRKPRGSTTTAGRRGGLISSLIVFVFAGFAAGVSFARGFDSFTAVFIASSVFMLLLAVFVVMEFGTLVTGPDDLAFYVPLPVPARVYVGAKIAVTWIFGLAFALAFAIPSIVIAPAAEVRITDLFAEIYALADAAVIASLLVIVLLGVAVRFISYRRVREVAAWAQFVIFIAVYGVFFIFQRSVGSASRVVLIFHPLLLLAPSSWAASVLRLGAGSIPVVGVLLSVGVPLILFFVAVRVVSAAYEGKIADADSVETRARGNVRIAGGGGLLWRSPEERGVALLIANLFRHEPQFRMGVLTIIPVTILYVGIILFANRAPILDPFTAAGRAGFASTLLLYLAVGFFPTYVKNALTFSNQSEASWLFHASPANRLLILRAARRFILVFFITPYLVMLTVLYAILTREILHTLMHFAAITLLVLIETDVLLLFSPRLPFSRPLTAGRRGGGPIARMLAGVIILLPIYLMVVFVYPYPLAVWLCLAGLAGVLTWVRIAGRRHAAWKLEREELIP
jgi:hypothetical protein